MEENDLVFEFEKSFVGLSFRNKRKINKDNRYKRAELKRNKARKKKKRKDINGQN